MRKVTCALAVMLGLLASANRSWSGGEDEKAARAILDKAPHYTASDVYRGELALGGVEHQRVSVGTFSLITRKTAEVPRRCFKTFVR